MKKSIKKIVIMVMTIMLCVCSINAKPVQAKTTSQWYKTMFYGGKKKADYDAAVIYNGKITKNKLIIYGSVDKVKYKGTINEKRIRLKSKKRSYKLAKNCKYYGVEVNRKLYMSRENAARQFKATLKLYAMGFSYKIKNGKVVAISFSS